MQSILKKHPALKILLALFPTLIFTQNYAWMTLNSNIGLAFLIIWAIMVWSVSQLSEKNQIMERLFRLTEISFFLLPLSAIVFMFVFGSVAVNSATNGAEQTGMAIGTFIGGTFVVILAFVIGLAGGIIMHLIAHKYDKGAKASGIKPEESVANKHGIILALAGVILLTLIFGVAANMRSTSKFLPGKADLQQAGNTNSQTEPAPKINNVESKVKLEIISKDFNPADIMTGIYQDAISFKMNLINTTDKAITGVEGTVTFYDIFDNEIKAISLSYDKGIPINGIKEWDGQINYNQFMDEDVKLKDTDLKNLRYKWEVKTIIYDDGSKDTF